MEFLSREASTIALCWRLERRDGAAIGFTSHDRDLFIQGLNYRAAPGMLPSAVALSDGFDIDSLDVEGALSADAIRGEDLAAGRWDDARLFLFMADWEDPSQMLPIARGTLGDVGIKGSAFEAELRGPTAALDRPVVEQTSPECRAELGDKRCRVDMAARIVRAKVASVVEEDLIEVDRAEPRPNAYGYGRLRWLSGANSGLSAQLLWSDGARLKLSEPPAFAPEAGDLVEVREGCERSFATCLARFGNAANFRGEPHLPGMDLLTRYPGG